MNVFREKHKLHALGQLSIKHSKISSIEKILIQPGLGGNVQDVDLYCFHGIKYALRCYLFIGSKKVRFEGEKFSWESRKLVEKSIVNWKINTIIAFWEQFMP